MKKYSANTFDALMKASDLGEFTKKEWNKLTAGIDTYALNTLAQHGVVNIREEQIGYKTTKGRVFKIYDSATHKLLCDTTDRWFADKIESMKGCRVECTWEEIKFPIYCYWYSVNPAQMKEFFRHCALYERDRLTTRIDNNVKRVRELEKKIKSAEIERDAMTLFLAMM